MSNSPFQINYTNEIVQGLDELIEGQIISLNIEIEDMENHLMQTKNDCIYVGDLEVYPKSRKVINNGEEAILTPKEYDILYFLVKNCGTVFTKEQIYKAVWDSEYLLDDSNIMAFIRKLRKKIEPNPDAPEYIITIWGVGYKFNDDI